MPDVPGGEGASQPHSSPSSAKSSPSSTPEEKDEFPPKPRYHGRHQLNRHPDGLEKCVGCELCAWALPTDAIFVRAQTTVPGTLLTRERYGRVYQINYLRCIGCGLCIEACPTRALTMIHEFELADSSRPEADLRKQGPSRPVAARGWKRRRTTWWPAPPRRTTTRGGSPGSVSRSRTTRSKGAPRDRNSGRAENTGEAAVFWVCAVLAMLGALGMLFSRKAVHSALFLAMTMINLAILYVPARPRSWAWCRSSPVHQRDR